jgi:hypothetical protein
MSSKTFWTNVSPWEPKRQFRFKVYFDGLKEENNSNFVWYAKSIDKPTMTFKVANEGEANVGSQIPDEKILSVPKMSDITMVLVDPSYPNASRKLLSLANSAGYLDEAAGEKNKNLGNFDGDAFRKSIGRVWFEQLDHGTCVAGDKHKAMALETWELEKAYIKSINFGKLDYSSDDFVEITVVFGYTSFTCIQHGANAQDGLEMGPFYDGTAADESAPSFKYYEDPAENAFTQIDTGGSSKPTRLKTWNFSK